MERLCSFIFITEVIDITLEEHIWEEERFISLFASVAYDTRLHDENGELMWKAEQYEKSQHEHEERKALLEELKNLREEHRVYKKALEISCNIIENHAYCPYMCDGNRECIDCLLQKARNENEKSDS